MAYLPEFANDVFISYRRAIDEGPDRWVQSFEAALRLQLKALVGDVVVWRDAATGRELARSGKVPAMTQGSAVQPGYGGSVYFPSSRGTLYKLTPKAAR